MISGLMSLNEKISIACYKRLIIIKFNNKIRVKNGCTKKKTI